jgi:hypothetical protein
MTWKEVKDAALQMMFAYSSGGRLIDAAQDYLLAMPAVANTAIRDLAAVCPVRRTLTIKQYPDTNIADDYTETDDGYLFTAMNAKSFYCEMDGRANVRFEYVEGDGTIILLDMITVDNKTYKPVRYKFEQGARVRVYVEGNPDIKDYAFYAREYGELSEIPSPADVQRYSVKGLVSEQHALRFMRFDIKPFRLGHRDISAYVYYDGADTIMVPSLVRGEITVYYEAYPTQITANTLDAHEIELDGEACDIIPFYIASVLYAEDDRELASYYRREYNARKGEIVKPSDVMPVDELYSTSGWI